MTAISCSAAASRSDYARYRDQMSDYYAELDDARSAYASAAKLANDNYWSSLEYQADREDAANAQYWKQLAYADKAGRGCRGGREGGAERRGEIHRYGGGQPEAEDGVFKAGGRSTGVKRPAAAPGRAGRRS